MGRAWSSRGDITTRAIVPFSGGSNMGHGEGWAETPKNNFYKLLSVRGRREKWERGCAEECSPAGRGCGGSSRTVAAAALLARRDGDRRLVGAAGEVARRETGRSTDQRSQGVRGLLCWAHASWIDSPLTDMCLITNFCRNNSDFHFLL